MRVMLVSDVSTFFHCIHFNASFFYWTLQQDLGLLKDAFTKNQNYKKVNPLNYMKLYYNSRKDILSLK